MRLDGGRDEEASRLTRVKAYARGSAALMRLGETGRSVQFAEHAVRAALPPTRGEGRAVTTSVTTSRNHICRCAPRCRPVWRVSRGSRRCEASRYVDPATWLESSGIQPPLISRHAAPDERP